MKKLIIVIVALLIVCLSVTPVVAKTEPRIYFKVVGEWNSEFLGATAKVTVTADSVNNIITLEAKWEEKVWWPGYGGAPEQWMTGMYDEGPLGIWELSEDGSTITLYTEPSEVSVLPSGDSTGIEPGKVYVGTITGKKVTFVIQNEPELTPLTGKIKIK